MKNRAVKDGRVVPKDVFIDQYFAARFNVNKLKEVFGNEIHVYLVIKNNDGTNYKYKQNITVVDNHIEEQYSKHELSGILK